MATDIRRNMRGTSLQVPDNLNVTGRGLSPNRPHSPSSPEDATMRSVPTSSRTSLSDDELEAGSEEYTVLDGVREMNQILVRQIETLRLKIKVDEKNYDQDKARLVMAKESELRVKNEEIEELRESVTARDDAIQKLSRAGEEKDRTIETKCAEIEELKGMVRQTKEYAQRMHKQMAQAKKQREKLESDPLYQQQNEEITKLTSELETLRGRLATMETELSRALTIIEQQNVKLKSLDAERAALHAKFREDLDRASRAMRQEVERMREVMRQNYDEMRNLREQNQEMHGDVRAIKEMLRASKTGQHETLTGLQRPLTASPHPAPTYGRQTHGQPTAVAPRYSRGMTGGSVTKIAAPENRRVPNGHPPGPPLRESTHFAAKVTAGRAGGVGPGPRGSHPSVDSSGYYSNSSTARLSPDVVKSRPPVSVQAANKVPQNSMTTISYNSNGTSGDSKGLPAICSMKEGVLPLPRQPSGRVRPVVRKGSAVAKK